YIAKIKEEYAELRSVYSNRKVHEFLSIEAARANKFPIDWNTAPIYQPSFIGLHVERECPIETIIPYIDWQYFFHAWEMKGKYPAILDDPEKGSEAQKLFADAQKMLTEIIQTQRLKAHSVVGFFPANSVGDDIEVYADE